MGKADLIQYLCVVAGIIMEDASVEAISAVSPDPTARRERLARLGRAACDCQALIAAAEVLDRRPEE